MSDTSNNQAKPITSKGKISGFITEARRKTEYISADIPSSRPKARLVGRSIYHIEVWSVFKISLLVNFSIWVIFMVMSAVLWGIATVTNLVSRIENFVTDILALESYNLPFIGTLFIFAIVSLAGVFLATAFTVLMCVIFNQLSRIFGGIRMLVLEEDSLRLPAATPNPDDVRVKNFKEDISKD